MAAETAETRAAAAGESDVALELHRRLAAWTDAAFVESNPIPAKAALRMLGLCEDVLRLPLVPLADAHRARVEQALRAAGAFDHAPGSDAVGAWEPAGV